MYKPRALGLQVVVALGVGQSQLEEVRHALLLLHLVVTHAALVLAVVQLLLQHIQLGLDLVQLLAVVLQQDGGSLQALLVLLLLLFLRPADTIYQTLILFIYCL